MLGTVLAAEVADAERGAASAAWGERLGCWRRAVAAGVVRFRGRLLGPVRAADGALLAAFDGPARAVRCAAALRDSSLTLLGRALRAGLHAGEVAPPGDAAGETGAGGFAESLALRVAALARPGEVLATSTVRDLVAGSGLRFREREQRFVLPLETGGGRLALLALAGDDRPPDRPPGEAGAGDAVAPPARPDPVPVEASPGLSAREREILRLVARGLSNPAIAAELALPEHTVKRHVANILVKLNLPTRAAASAAAARAGLL